MVPIIKAHAGDRSAPRNSLAYLRKAIAAGADIVELDVRETADHLVVAWHDDSAGGAEISKTPYERLRAKSPGILLLKDALPVFLHSGTVCNIDLKNFSAFPAVLEVLENAGMEKNAVFSGLQFAEVPEAVRWISPRQLWVSTEYRPEGISDGEWPEYTRRALSLSKQYGCTQLNANIANVSMNFIRQAHQAGISVHVWTAETEEQMRRLASWNADSIAADDVEMLRRVLRSVSASSDLRYFKRNRFPV